MSARPFPRPSLREKSQLDPSALLPPHLRRPLRRSLPSPPRTHLSASLLARARRGWTISWTTSTIWACIAPRSPSTGASWNLSLGNSTSPTWTSICSSWGRRIKRSSTSSPTAGAPTRRRNDPAKARPYANAHTARQVASKPVRIITAISSRGWPNMCGTTPRGASSTSSEIPNPPPFTISPRISRRLTSKSRRCSMMPSSQCYRMPLSSASVTMGT